MPANSVSQTLIGAQMIRKTVRQDKRPISELRNNTAVLVERARESKRPIVITQRGKNAAVLLGVREYDALLERLELLQDIHVAEAQFKAGMGIEHEEARRQVLAKLRK